MLTKIWFGFFITGFLAVLYQVFQGNTGIVGEVVQSTFAMARLAVEISIGLMGVLCLWLGLFKIAEDAGLIQGLSRLLSPLFQRLMPEIPPSHPAFGSVTMNMAANMLGLDNAATPMGLKAMKDLQSLNPSAGIASNAQILFLVLNTSAVTLIPVTLFLYRAQQGAAEPAAIFIPVLLATSASTLTGLLAVSWVQKLNLFDRVVIAYISGFILLLTVFMYSLASLSSSKLAEYSSLIGNLTLLSIIILFLTVGMLKKVDVYDRFIEGAKEGFSTAVHLIPYLVAMLVAIGVLRSSGVLDLLLEILQQFFQWLGVNTEFIPALPTAFLKPLSGSGSRAMMLETMNNYGVDSFPALLAATIQGSTETTFYVIAVYFGSVGIKNVRYAITCGLLADLAGVLTAILVGYWFYYPAANG